VRLLSQSHLLDCLDITDDGVVFGRKGEAAPRFTMREEDWVDAGWPQSLTVRVSPRDLLNDG
jgi:hypothetical protein